MRFVSAHSVRGPLQASPAGAVPYKPCSIPYLLDQWLVCSSFRGCKNPPSYSALIFLPCLD